MKDNTFRFRTFSAAWGLCASDRPRAGRCRLEWGPGWNTGYCYKWASVRLRVLFGKAGDSGRCLALRLAYSK